MYDDIAIPLPNASKEKIENMHPYNQWIQKHHEIDICVLTDEEIKENRRAYYAMITYIDDKVGKIMSELERLHMMENTIIIFTSDHGGDARRTWYVV